MRTWQALFVSYWSATEFLLLVAAALTLFAPASLNTLKHSQAFVRLCAVVSALLTIAFAAEAVAYLFLPNYFDYAEPMIVLLATNFINGMPVYQNSAAGGEVAGSLYGPLSFLIHAPLLWIWPTIAASKLMGIVVAVASIGIVWSITGPTLPARVRLSLLGLHVAAVSFYGVSGFWNRPDPELILLVCFGVLLHLRARPVAVVIGVAVLCGAAANLKPHGWLYVFPLALPALMQLQDARTRVRASAAGVFIALPLFLLPYAFSNISLVTYIENLLKVGRHGLLLSLFLQGAGMACAVLWIPVAWVWRDARPGERVLASGAIIASILVAIASSKPGGGSYHLMPFAPIAIYLLRSVLMRTRSDAAFVRLSWLVLSFIGLVAPVFAFTVWKTHDLFPDRALALAQRDEAAELFTKYRGAEMGVGATTNGSRQKLRVFAGLSGHSVLFDIVNWQDMRLANEPIEDVYPLLDECRVPAWVMPKGEPEFSAMSQTDPPIPFFDDTFRTRFFQRYSPEQEGRFFVVWTCRGGK